MLRMLLALIITDVPFLIVLIIILVAQIQFALYFIIVSLFILYAAKSTVFAYLAYQILREWGSTSYFISGTMLICTEGVLEQDEHVIDLGGIQGVELYQDLVGMVLNFGEVVLIGREHIRLRGIESPRHYEGVIRSFIEEKKGG